MHFKHAALLLLPAVLAGGAIADTPKTAVPKVGDRLAVYKPTTNLNSTGNRQCETC